jgi:predicted MFS family arabinose efflux permease
MLWFVLAASVAAPLHQFKVPPVMPILMDTFGLPVGRAGLLMSVFSITGLILALPAGFIYQKLGYRTTFLIAFFCMASGSIAGALSPDAGTMLMSRVVEGMGLCLITMAAPPLIRLLFPQEKRGRAMAVWVVYVPLGQMIVFSAAPYIAATWGWRGLWWWASAFTALAGILFCLFVKPASGSAPPGEEGAGMKEMRRVLLNRDLWLLGFLFLCFNFVFIAFRTWTPTFLFRAKGLPAGYGSFLMALMSVFIIAPAPFIGWACDRIGSLRLVCVISMCVFMVMLPLSSSMGPSMLVPWLAVLGVICGFLPTAVFLAATELIREERFGGLTMVVIQLGQNGGMLLGPLAFGVMVSETQSWYSAFWMLAPVSAAGAASVLFTRVR